MKRFVGFRQKKSLVKLEEELENIKSYICIQKYRYGERIYLNRTK